MRGLQTLQKDLKRNRVIYFMVLPTVIYFIVFHYVPMYGAQIAFRNYTFGGGLFGSEWAGLENFERFFTSYHFPRLMRNTLVISMYSILISFPAPIILALLINELRRKAFKRVVQTITYIPHFISLIVVCGLIVDFSVTTGLFNKITSFFGAEATAFLSESRYFRGIYIGSEIWQEAGWNSIVFLAALSAVDTQLYDAASVDGAGKWHQMIHVTLAGIMPTVVIMLILRIGRIMDVGFEKILLLYNPATYEVADVISTYVYRTGLLQADYSYSTAIGLFNAVINCVMLVLVNRISRKATESSLW